MLQIRSDDHRHAPRGETQGSGEPRALPSRQCNACSHKYRDKKELGVNMPDRPGSGAEPKELSKNCESKTCDYAQANYEKQFHWASDHAVYLPSKLAVAA